MHKSLNADNIPIGWIKLCLEAGLDVLKGADNSPIA